MNDKLIVEQPKTFVAIDIAKHAHDVLHPKRKNIRLKIENNLFGFQKLFEKIKDDNNVLLGFEPTADYHRNIAYWFANKSISCHLVSSLACTRAREMLYKT